MTPLLLMTIVLPVAGGLFVLLSPPRARWLHNLLLLLAAAANLGVAYSLYGQESVFSTSWGGFGFEFALRLYHFSAFILLAVAGFGFLVGLYTAAFMPSSMPSRLFYASFLFSLALSNGSALADDLIALLFFWEGLLVTLFAMIYLGHSGAWKTAVKALIISGVADLCLLVGMGLTAYLAGTTRISQIHLALSGAGSLAFILMMIGAIAKGGAMPFHSWIPDAAVDAPLPFMALLPAALE